MSIERNGRTYGDSTLIGDYEQHLSHDSLDLAYSEACPIGPDLVKPVSQGGRGPDEMVKRYGEVIFWFKYLTKELKTPQINKKEIASYLTSPRLRLVDEPLGVHSDNWLPEEMDKYYFRSHAGYVLPRLLVDYMNIDQSDKSSRMQIGLDLFEAAAIKSNTETELIVNFAKSLSDLQSDKKPILKRLLGKSKLKEDNLFTAYRETLQTVEKLAPELWACYQSMSIEELDSLNIFHK